MNTVFNALLAGGVAMGSLVIALFFLRFWRSTHDRFFLYFALSFAVEAVGRVLLTFVFTMQDDAPLPYIMRIIAYGLIVYAIWIKNRTPAIRSKTDATISG